MSKGESITQVNGVGPSKVIYVTPPRIPAESETRLVCCDEEEVAPRLIGFSKAASAGR
jgi:hypothetical protein